MRRFLFLSCLTFFAVSPASADITSKIQSSISLTVDGAASQTTRIGSSYSVHGSNITLGTAGGLGSLTPGSAVGYTPADYSITTAGDSFSFTETFLEGSAKATSTSVTAGVVTALPNYGAVTTTSGGVAGSLAGSLDSGSAMAITAGGAGTAAVAQLVVELTVK